MNKSKRLAIISILVLAFLFGVGLTTTVWSSPQEPPDESSPPEDLALNPDKTGFPHPLESDNGWGMGSYKWDIVDGIRKEATSYNGLAFTGGTRPYPVTNPEPCGWRQATINFGRAQTFDTVTVWHHGQSHLPNTYKIQIWDGTVWTDVFSTEGSGLDYWLYPATEPSNWWEANSTPTENTFDAVTSDKVRFALWNCDITHGWIYEFEVTYKNRPPAPTITAVSPLSAANDLNTLVTISGTEFFDPPTVSLGPKVLDDVAWLSSTLLTATIPWGFDPGDYALTVLNPGGRSDSLPNAFAVTQGIGVWNPAELYGGAVNEVVVHPQTPETVYAVSDDVGMFRSEDGAKTWTFQVAGGEYSVRNLAIDPISPTVMYMYMPWDLHRSDDGGDTWTPLDAPADIPFPHPTESGTLFVSNRGEGESGLWRSINYGQTWLTVTAGLTDTRVNNLVFDPTDPMTLYVGTELGNLFVSGDGGASWSFVDHPLDYIGALAINPRGNHELWASNCCFCNPNTTLRSTNTTHTAWITVAEPVGSMPLTSIEFAPDAWGAAYSQTLFVSDCWGEVQMSRDNGDSWTSLDPEPDEWHWGLGLHPSDPTVLYATGNRQAMYKTTDGGTTWPVAHEGLTAVIPEHLATVTGQPGTLYAVTHIGLLKGTGGGAAWQSLPVGGGVSFIATDPFTPGRVYAIGGVGMGQDLPIYISGDGGQTWPITSYLSEPIRYDEYAHLDPILQPDPSQTGVLLTGVRHAIIEPGGSEAGTLYRSQDAGLTWDEVDVGQAIAPVQDIAYDVVEPAVVYLATSDDWQDFGTGLFRSTDSGLTWQPVGADVADLDQSKSIAVEPRPPYRTFALANKRVYVSEDRGLTWAQTNISHGAIESLYSSHDSPNSTLYLAGGMGLWQSTDGGDSWGPVDGALGQMPAYSLAEAVTADRTVLYAGTTGGYVTTGAVQARSQPLAESSLVNAGVYRFTTPRDWRVYLPVVLRDSR